LEWSLLFLGGKDIGKYRQSKIFYELFVEWRKIFYVLGRDSGGLQLSLSESEAEITSCQNKIDDLKKQQQQKINLINQLKTDIKNHEEALDKVKEIIKSEGNFENKISDISNKTNEAAINYSSMECSEQKFK